MIYSYGVQSRENKQKTVIAYYVAIQRSHKVSSVGPYSPFLEPLNFSAQCVCLCTSLGVCPTLAPGSTGPPMDSFFDLEL